MSALGRMTPRGQELPLPNPRIDSPIPTLPVEPRPASGQKGTLRLSHSSALKTGYRNNHCAGKRTGQPRANLAATSPRLAFCTRAQRASIGFAAHATARATS